MIHLRDILVAANGKLVTGDENTEFKGISIDSRRIKEGYLFIPILGERFDGHSFIEGALKLGAIGTLTSQEIDIKNASGKCIIMVEDTLKALQDISKYFLKKANIPVVAVTGSTGKTTTKELIYNVLSQKYNVLRNKGNFNNHIGLPLTLLKIEKGHEMVVAEMGMSNSGEIDVLAGIATPEVGAITNIGICHIENLGSKEAIFNAKMEISNHMNESSVLILNGDDEYLSNMKNKNTIYKKVFVGMNGENDIRVTKVNDLGYDGVEFLFTHNNDVHDVKLNVPGTHNVYNALVAIAVGLNYNIPVQKIKEGLASFVGDKMRLNIIDLKEGMKLINDCYNANPDSTEAALNVLKGIDTGRKIAVLGDMLELGDFSEAAHREVGEMVVNKGIDILITVGISSHDIAKAAIEGGFDKEKVFATADNMTAINVLNNIMKAKDIVLIKGSRGMKMEEIVQYLQERR